jgi:hypothetical protein
MRAFIAIDPTRARDKTPLLMRWLRLGPAAPEAGNGSRERVPETPSPAAMPDAADPNTWLVHRAAPGDAQLLAALLTRIEERAEPLSRAEILERQGKYGYWFVRAGETVLALAAWQAENLAAVVRELWVARAEDAALAFPPLLRAIEAEANALTCEVVILLVPPRGAGLAQIAAESAGYDATGPEDLHKLWRAVVEPLLEGNKVLYAKRLREIVTRPI